MDEQERIETIHTLHESAMGNVDEADYGRRKGWHPDHALFSLRAALKLETKAAELAGNRQPARAVLYRSAATIALNCGELAKVEELCALGLLENPPPEIAAEINDVLNKARRRKGEG